MQRMLRTAVLTWREQLHGQAEYELARRVLRSVYMLREEIDHVRSPFVSSGERRTSFEETHLGVAGTVASDAEASARVYERRWRTLRGAWLSLRSGLLEAEVLWGPQVRVATDQLEDCLEAVGDAIWDHVDWSLHPASRDTYTPQDLAEYRAILRLSAPREQNDAFGVRLTAAVGDIEDLLRPHLILRRTPGRRRRSSAQADT